VTVLLMIAAQPQANAQLRFDAASIRRTTDRHDESLVVNHGSLIAPGAGIEGVKVAAFEEGFSLFAYALDQIGLRLEAQRALAEMLVVDHVEKTPTEN
jgi:Protein of unknown function (DUF3738)